MSSRTTLKCPQCRSLIWVSPDESLGEGTRIECGNCGKTFVLRRRPSRTTPIEPPAPPAPGATPRSVAPDGGAEATIRVTIPTAAAEPTTPTLALTPASPGSGQAGSAAETGPGFAKGDLLARRYRIVRYIDQGGMGEVYEAHDQELDERVAVKTLRPQLARDPRFVDRFRREIQLARKVTHPNVCRIFDLAYHSGSGAASGEQVLFLTMELLTGEPLSRRLAREGHLSSPEAFPLAQQMAAALDAAHRAGVVHRDFKSGNVMLVKESWGSRAVITDFGLARASRGAHAASGLTAEASVLGTPHYLAPEILENGSGDASVDIYAFGVVLFEMVTGRFPFEDSSPIATAVLRLKQPPTSPRVYNPQLPESWEVGILRCLARKPADRFATAGAAAAALAGKPEAPSTQGKKRAHRPTSWRKILLLAALVLASVVVGTVQYRAWKARHDTIRQILGVTAESVVPRRSLAVLELRNLTSEDESAWLGPAVSEMLRGELRTSETLRVISGDNITRAGLDLSLPEGEGTGPQLAHLRQVLGSDYIVSGSLTALGAAPSRQLRLDLVLHDAVAGSTVGSWSETGQEEELFDLISQAGGALRERLGVADSANGGTVRKLSPTLPEAARLYAEGLEHLRLSDPLGARELLERAVALEPTAPLAHSNLASAYAALGYEAKARDAARRALQLAQDLPREARMSIEAQLLESEHKWAEAAEVYRSLWALFPDNLEYGLQLAAMQTQAGMGREALSLVTALRTLPTAATEDPRIDLTEAAAAALGDPERQLRAAEQAAAKGRERGLRSLEAQALLSQCNALRQLGRPQEATAACQASEEIHRAVGDGSGAAAAMTSLASVLFDQGDLAGARSLLEGSLATYREISNLAGAVGVLNNLAVVLRNQGETARARRIYEDVLTTTREMGSELGETFALNNLASLLVHQGELATAREHTERALEISRKIGDRAGEAAALERLGVVRLRQGDPEAARSWHEEARRIYGEMGQPRGEAVALNNLARTDYTQGDLQEARRHFEESLALSQSLGYRSLAAASLYGLAEVDLQEADLEAAIRRHREALSAREELGEEGTTAQSRAALARALTEAGYQDEAEVAARRSVARLEDEGEGDSLAEALVALSYCLFATQQQEELVAVSRRAEELAAHSEDLPLRLEVALVQAERLRSEGLLEDALEVLDETRRQAEERNLYPLYLEAMLARLRLTPPSESLDLFRQASSLALAARERGFLRLADRLRAELRGSPTTTDPVESPTTSG